MTKRDHIRYGVDEHGCIVNAKDVRKGQKCTCEACRKQLDLAAGQVLDPYLRHRKGDFKVCPSYQEQSFRFPTHHTFTKKLKRENKELEIVCSDCPVVLPPPSINNIPTFNREYKPHLRYAIDNDESRIKAKKDCRCIVPSCCDVCQTMKNEKLAEQQAAKKRKEQEVAESNAREAEISRIQLIAQQIATKNAQDTILLQIQEAKQLMEQNQREAEISRIKRAQCYETIVIETPEAKKRRIQVTERFLYESTLKKAADKARAAEDNKKIARLKDELAMRNNAARQVVEDQLMNRRNK
jgi:hypothetical protein